MNDIIMERETQEFTNQPTNILIAEAVPPKSFDKKSGYPTNLQSLRNFDNTKLQTSSSYIREKQKKLSRHGDFWRNAMSRSPISITPRGVRTTSAMLLNKTFANDALLDHSTSPDIGGTLLTDRSDYEPLHSSRGPKRIRKINKVIKKEPSLQTSLKESLKSTPSKKSLQKERATKYEESKAPRLTKAKLIEQNLKDCLKSMLVKK